MSPLVLGKILGVLVNTLTADDLHLKKGRFLLNFLFHFWNLHQILKILEEKMNVIANVFLKLQQLKT